MKLYGVHLSPYFERNWLQLHLKGQTDAVAYPGVPGNALGSETHLSHNPIGRIPYLEVAEGDFLPEAQVIADYIERMFPAKPLRPQDPAKAARVDLICRILDIYILPELILYGREAGKHEPDSAFLDEKGENVRRGVRYLDHFFAAQDWAVGDEPSLADCALLPFLFFIGMVQSMAKVDFLADAPKLGAYRALVADTELARTAFANMQTSLEQVRAARKAAEG